MQRSIPEGSPPEVAPPAAGSTEDDVVARFHAEYLEPMRAQQASIDAARPDPLPQASLLLAQALAARRITVKKVTEGRWVFQFTGSTIGGYSLSAAGHGVTTLVSAQARRVLRDTDQVRAHLDLMEIPHPAPFPEASSDEATAPLFGLDMLLPGPGEDAPQSGGALQLEVYAVGPEVISVLALVPDTSGRALSVDVTDSVSADISSLAVDAMRAIPGLLCAGVGLEVRTLDSAEGAQVVGIDETASMVPHHFPALGRGRQVAEAIAEQILFTAAL